MASKKKSTGLPTALVKGVYSDPVNNTTGPDYPEPGVGYRGYAKIANGSSWQLLKQEPYRVMITLGGGLPNDKMWPIPGKTVYITQLNLDLAPGNLAVGYIYDTAWDLGSSRVMAYYELDARHATDSLSRTMYFDPPLKCDRILSVNGGNAVWQFSVQLFGYTEDSPNR